MEKDNGHATSFRVEGLGSLRQKRMETTTFLRVLQRVGGRDQRCKRLLTFRVLFRVV